MKKIKAHTNSLLLFLAIVTSLSFVQKPLNMSNDIFLDTSTFYKKEIKIDSVEFYKKEFTNKCHILDSTIDLTKKMTVRIERQTTELVKLTED